VLVRPEAAANVGAAARVIRNAGLTGLDLVAPSDWRTLESWRTAWGAQQVLEQAREFADLEAAVSASSLVAAFSGRADSGVAPSDVRELASDVAALGPAEQASLVFGPESSGLSSGEIALCGRVVRIPAHPDQPSLNLSHAVMVAGYEIYRAGRRPQPRPRLSTHEERERMLALLREALLALEALPKRDPDRRFARWREMFQRAPLFPREVRLLEHMARKVRRLADSGHGGRH
jgi:TrmH family RNA methyltransferase